MGRFRGLILLALFLIIAVSKATDLPGFKGRVTRRGFAFFNKVALDFLLTKIESTKIPDQNVVAAGTKIHMSNIKIVSMPNTISGLMLPRAMSGLEWHVRNMEPTIHIDYKFSKFWSTHHGKIIVKANNFGFVLLLNIENNGGKPYIRAKNCKAFGDVDLTFNGDYDFVLNAASSILKTTISNTITEMICKNAVHEINVNAAKEIEKIKMVYEVKNSFEDFTVNLSLTGHPSFTRHYLDMPHKGELRLSKYRNQSYVQQPRPIPGFFDETKHMAYGFLTTYVVNSALDALQNAGKFNMVLDKSIVPKEFHQFLTTTCPEGASCLGSFFSLMERQYNNLELKVKIRSMKSPRVSFNHNKINIIAATESKVTVTKEGKEVVLIHATVHTSGTVHVSLNGITVHFSVNEILNDIDIVDSKIEVIRNNDFMVAAAIEVMEEKFLLPQINEFGKTGFTLPQIGDKLKLSSIQIINPNVKDLLAIGTNFEMI